VRDLEYTLVTDRADLGKVCEAVQKADAFALDLETTALNPLDGDIRLISIGCSEEAFVVDLFQTGGLGPLEGALRTSKGVKIIQNAKFDQKWLLHHYNLELWPIFDTYRASAVIHNGRKVPHDLYTLYSRELGMLPRTQDLGGSNWAGALTKEQYDYAADDVILLPALRDSLRKQIFSFGLQHCALIEFGSVLPESAVELKGFYIDQPRWLALARENKSLSDQYKKKLLAQLPNPSSQLTLPGMDVSWNLDSTPQLLVALQKLNPKIANTAEIDLAQFLSAMPVIADIFKYREYSKCLAAFGPSFLEYVHPKTGRIHPQYYPFTGAGRFSCSAPNLQQIPRDTRFRECFRPENGRVYVVADYAGIEMRIAAEIAQDETLLRIFKEDKDAHYHTAAVINNVAEKDITKAQRQAAKAVNFGLIYGMGADKLVLYAQSNYGVSMTKRQAETFIERYFSEYSSIQRWHKRAVNDGKRCGFTRTLSGRVRYLEAENTYSEFMNTPVQGTGADGLKRALREVYFRLKPFGDRAKMVHHVHDEIICEVDDDADLVEAVKNELRIGMQEAMATLLKSVPVRVDPGSGKTWADAK
jgi:DNA polymerase I-like protein with 3'-5' exonuclease and polymerase domains